MTKLAPLTTAPSGSYVFISTNREVPLIALEEYRRAEKGLPRKCCWCGAPIPRNVARFVGKGRCRVDQPYFCHPCGRRRALVQDLAKEITRAIEFRLAELPEPERLSVVNALRSRGHEITVRYT